MTLSKPHSPACERNRDPILAVLREHFADRRHVLEIGSGTGQHAVHFAAALPHLIWQTSERAEHLPGIHTWLDDADLPNTPATIVLDVAGDQWPNVQYDAIYTANTLHIMAWHEVEQMFARLPSCMTADALLVAYGPFNRDGRFSSESNAAFDASLKLRAPHMGIRDISDIDALALDVGLRRIAHHELPANNRCLVWQRFANS